MEVFRIPHRSDYSRNDGLKFDECVLCGARRYSALVHYDNSTNTPVIGETITGVTSGDTGVVEKVYNYAGTGNANYVYGTGMYGFSAYAGSNSSGILVLTSITGYDKISLDIFQDNEYITGSVSGASFATVNKTGSVQVSGRLVPDSELIEYQGKKYCRQHFRFKFGHTWVDEQKVDSGELDRE